MEIIFFIAALVFLHIPGKVDWINYIGFCLSLQEINWEAMMINRS